MNEIDAYKIEDILDAVASFGVGNARAELITTMPDFLYFNSACFNGKGPQLDSKPLLK